MATPGWYPDPGGAPGRFRYWDGSTWAAETVASPGAGGPATGGPRRRRVGLWIAVAVGVVVLALAMTLIVRSLGARTPSGTLTPGTSTTGGTTAEQTPTPTPTPVRTPSPIAPTAVTPTAAGSCPDGQPLARQDHPNDGRVHGGGLSIPAPAGWIQQGPPTTSFSWAYDVGETDATVGSGRNVTYAVGALSLADGFDSPRAAAALSMVCTLTTSAYADAVNRADLTSRSGSLDGHPTWTVESEITVPADQGGTKTDLVRITVVDLGSETSLSFFWGSAPIEDAVLVDRLQRTAARLQVD